ncbi:MAG: hypothetical protein IKX06_01930 [Clostridia bacterium]|nr:hypothetical protein [Clostridia bacterium]
MAKRKNSDKNERPTLGQRFRYWFDNRMSKGSLGLIRILLAATVIVIVIIAVLILVLGFSEDGDVGGVFWETMSTVINAWMPSYEDGSIGYVILMALAAVSGLLVTSVLIGIFSTAIEEKITNLKNGNSAIIEEDHVVLLGFVEGEYLLIQQIVDASADDRRCVVIAGAAERSEMEESIRDNVEIPKKVRLVCRNIDIYDPASLKKCCIERAQAVIINPMNDVDTVKAILAVSNVLGDEKSKVRVYSVVSGSRYLLPDSFVKEHNVTQLLANRILSKVIAHSCTQPGISPTLMEFLDYDGCNLYGIDLKEAEGLTFEDASLRISGGVLLGFCENDSYRINPDAGSVIGKDVKLLVFTEAPEAVTLSEETDVALRLSDKAPALRTQEDILILGANEEITTVLQELPANTGRVRIAGADDAEKAAIEECVGKLRDGEHHSISVEILPGSVPDDPGILAEMIRDAGHLVLLNDHEKSEEEADTENIMRLLNLKTIRREKHLSFSITAELRRELSQRLADTGDSTDFVVATNMVSLFLSQLADSPDLESVFRELLSSDGNEIYLRSAEELGLEREITVREARKAALRKGYVLLGVMDEEDGVTSPVFDPPVDLLLTLDDNDRLIVIGEN